MPSNAMREAGREQTRQALYGEVVRQYAEIEDSKAQLEAKPRAASRRKPKE